MNGTSRIIAFAVATAFGLAAPMVLAHGDKPAHKEKPQATSDHGHGKSEGHGHGAEIGEPGDPKQVIRTFRLSAGDDNKFRPAVFTVRAGETIKFVLKNEGKLKHEMMIGTQDELKEHAAAMAKNPEMEHDDPNAVSVQPGKTGELVWKFTKPGEVHFGCLVPGHYEGGMVGKVIVNN